MNITRIAGHREFTLTTQFSQTGKMTSSEPTHQMKYNPSEYTDWIYSYASSPTNFNNELDRDWSKMRGDVASDDNQGCKATEDTVIALNATKCMI
uniref:AlNc14C87G5558 protein n=1 Tax=Albugo laibachii Nc14 TaxID=890382 RepID=F0WG26_9STRA|nr:AlNc14C87G5558 [Albugo laibachii Nc14]|eukprot:CCA20160.1 AlNc14C87G5558 [Albugo laibachii Nc14]